jgi:cytochrome c oxidase cbb3-type subunit 3
MGAACVKRVTELAASRTARRRLAGLALLLILAGVCAYVHQRRIADRLLRTEPTQILEDPALLRRALDLSLPVYQKHCAACHGATLEGNRARGVPDLAKNAWLYGNDPVDVEHTILYGIRSGHPKSRNVTDMPALVRSGQITADDAKDVVEFLESLAGVPYDREGALRGRALYYGKGNCFDCHARDARGVSDYGTPALTGPVWLYGADRGTLYVSILNGRHGICPAWVNLLTPLEIRALTLYLVSAPHSVASRH